MDTERRIEKAFHEQTQFLSQKTDAIQNAFQEQTRFLAQQQANANEKLDYTIRLSNEKLYNTVRWMIGFMITMIVAVAVAIFLKPNI